MVSKFSGLKNKTYLQSSEELFSKLYGLLIKSNNTMFSIRERKQYINDFNKFYFEDLITNNKYFVESYALDKIIKSREESLSKMDINSSDLPFYNYFLDTKEKFTDRITKNRENKDRLKYTFDYYFYFLDILAEYINYCHFHHNAIAVEEKLTEKSSIVKSEPNKKSSKTPIVFGIQAPQGSGKTTICEMLTCILRNKFGLKVHAFSSDNYYLPYEKLIELRENDPLFKYRGPPGTHDLDLLEKTLVNFKQQKSGYYIESFDKRLFDGVGDRVPHSPENYIDASLDILIFEGWFNGIKPASGEEIERNLDEVIRSNKRNYSNEEKRDILKLQFQVNENLKNYLKIWDFLDRFIILKPEFYNFSKIWRIQTEKEKGGLNEAATIDFIEYSWNAIPPTLYFDHLLRTNYNAKTFINEILKPIIVQCDFERNYYI